MRTARAGLLALAVLVAGCGDDALWARWQVESALYHARALENHVLTRDHATDADMERVQRGLQDVVDRFPASTWVGRAADAGPARDVALASGRAAVDIGLVLGRRGRDADAIAQLERVERDDAPLSAVVVPARLARIDALERTGRFDEAMAERVALAATDPLDGPAGTPLAAVLPVAVDLAGRLRASGRDAEADAALAGADEVFTRAMSRAHGPATSVLADALSRIRAARHDAPGALAVLRTAMRAGLPWQVPYYARAMAARALDAGAPESVLVYARWAANLRGSRDVAGPAWFAAAQAWEALGNPDSALANYDAVLRTWMDPGTLGPLARFREAELLERIGQWDRARGAYLALEARYPTHPLAFESARRVVRHHMQQNEPELALVAGEQSVQNLGHLLETDLDPEVQRDARSVRADLLLMMGRLREAEDGLLELWRRFPADSVGQDAGLRAAQLAEHQPGEAGRADSILSALRRGASNATVRRALGLGGAPAPGASGGRR